MRDTIERLRAMLPPLLTLDQYRNLTHRCPASAYNDLRTKPGLGLKIAGSTRIVRDVMLDHMAHSEWVPRKDRVNNAGAKGTKKSTRLREPQRERDPEVRP